MNRQDAITLLHEHVTSESLRAHCLAVAYAMQSYAQIYNEDEEQWFVCGLLHDFDYEKHPTLEEHPYKGVAILKEKGESEELCTAILGHGNHTGVKRETNMAKSLFAVDELSGFIVAVAKMRPEKFVGLSVKSVKKKLKSKPFAAAISREDIQQGIKELNVNKEEHIQRVIDALAIHAQELGVG